MDQTGYIPLQNFVMSWIKDVPQDLWSFGIAPFFNMHDLARIAPVATALHQLWNDFRETCSIRIPQDLPSVSQGLKVGERLNAHNRYTKAAPLVLKLDSGTYNNFNEGLDNVSPLYIRFCVNIVGAGFEKTTMRGGFNMYNTPTSVIHVVLTDMTISSCLTSGVGVFRGASFYGENLHICYCQIGVNVNGGASRARCKNIVTQYNTEHGILARSGSTVTLEGEQTSTHSNGQYGLLVDHRSLINLVQPLKKEGISIDNGIGSDCNFYRKTCSRIRRVNA